MSARRLKNSEQLGEDCRYELLLHIASGGMGAVYLGAIRGTRGPIYAIKRPHPHIIEEAEFRTMFLAEARLAARIRHPNAVGVVEVDEADQHLLLVMDYIEGGALGDLMAEAHAARRRMPASVTLRIVIDAARGLHAAHELRGDDGQLLGLVHRDVSPQNILVGTDGTAALVDFGVAKAAALGTARTKTGLLKGKVGYLAPEYLIKRICTPRSDVFSLGVVCWEALANRRLFHAEGELETMKLIRAPDAVPMLTGVASVDPDLAAIVARALCKDPDKRFTTAEELADALERKAEAAELLASHDEVGACVSSLLGKMLSERQRLLDKALEESTAAEIAAPASGEIGQEQDLGGDDAQEPLRSNATLEMRAVEAATSVMRPDDAEPYVAPPPQIRQFRDTPKLAANGASNAEQPGRQPWAGASPRETARMRPAASNQLVPVPAPTQPTFATPITPPRAPSSLGGSPTKWIAVGAIATVAIGGGAVFAVARATATNQSRPASHSRASAIAEQASATTANAVLPLPSVTPDPPVASVPATTESASSAPAVVSAAAGPTASGSARPPPHAVPPPPRALPPPIAPPPPPAAPPPPTWTPKANPYGK